MFKSLLLSISIVTILFAQSKDVTTVTVENPKIDSIEKVIEGLKFNMLKDKIFTKARVKFINSAFNDQINFLETLVSYRDSAFVIDKLESMKQIKDKEIEQLRELMKTDDYEVRGVCRLHIKKVQDQLLKIQNKIDKYTHDELMSIEHQVVESLKVE